MKWFYKLQGIIQEDIALITQNFLPCAETVPPVFALNIQILGAPTGYGSGKTPPLAHSGVAEGRAAPAMGSEVRGFLKGLLCLGLLLHSPESEHLGS